MASCCHTQTSHVRCSERQSQLHGNCTTSVQTCGWRSPRASRNASAGAHGCLRLLPLQDGGRGGCCILHIAVMQLCNGSSQRRRTQTPMNERGSDRSLAPLPELNLGLTPPQPGRPSVGSQLAAECLHACVLLVLFFFWGVGSVVVCPVCVWNGLDDVM